MKTDVKINVHIISAVIQAVHNRGWLPDRAAHKQHRKFFLVCLCVSLTFLTSVTDALPAVS